LDVGDPGVGQFEGFAPRCDSREDCGAEEPKRRESKTSRKETAGPAQTDGKIQMTNVRGEEE